MNCPTCNRSTTGHKCKYCQRIEQLNAEYCAAEDAGDFERCERICQEIRAYDIAN